MSTLMKVLLAANALLLFGLWESSGITYAQRPPQEGPDGIPYLKVNINPTNVPPLVNINPNGVVPKVDIATIPDFKIAPRGCESRQSYQTGIGKSISGPMMVTYLSMPQPMEVTLSGGGGPAQRMNFGSAAPLSTAIYLKADQRLQFDSDVLYSGCQPD